MRERVALVLVAVVLGCKGGSRKSEPTKAAPATAPTSAAPVPDKTPEGAKLVWSGDNLQVKLAIENTAGKGQIVTTPLT